jgi:hypothetical protein
MASSHLIEDSNIDPYIIYIKALKACEKALETSEKSLDANDKSQASIDICHVDIISG